MKALTILISAFFLSSGAFAHTYTNCIDRSTNAPSKLSVEFNTGLNGSAQITLKDGDDVYKGTGTAVEDYPIDHSYRSDIRIYGKIKDSANQSKALANVEMLISTAKVKNGQARIWLYMPKMETLFCNEN